ncbi:hypothetical protein GCM10023091_18270 [Ravibacter arvi]|uniref:Uncharacterized protein n=1 Tax=Ravibacter arvi TaxID=2051041 RepID=A0ABP8LWG4_9BACT
MKKTDTFPAILLTGLALGTAWAVRGQFGHEHGATWAGGIGCLTLLLLSKRKDWIASALPVTLAGALGWGIGGVASYGKVVGYARSTDFGNVYYGLLMLLIIGGLFGFLGGGLFGIALSTPKNRKGIPWHKLITEMVIGAIVTYFFVVEQFGWRMTPPRSELWAGCLGMAFAAAWYMVRQEMYAALRVALFTSFGAGFGFAFGNFLQVLGSVSELKFNFWNVMEYSIGFFGGTSMAYSVLTSKWEEKDQGAGKVVHQLPLIILMAVVPFIMWQQNVGTEKLHARFSGLHEGFPYWVSGLVNWGPYFLFFGLTYLMSRKGSSLRSFEGMFSFYKVYFGLYILLSILVTGAFFSLYRVEQYLYLLNFIPIIYLVPRIAPGWKNDLPAPVNYKLNLIWLLIFLAILAVLAANSHPNDLGGANYRFGPKANLEAE